MSEGLQSSVAELLEHALTGDAAALDALFPLVYEELRARAKATRRRWGGDDTLNTTALMHETYLKLAGSGDPTWHSRAHFLAIASRAMRQILVDYGRYRRAQKRGGGRSPVSLNELALAADAELTEANAEALVALDESLDRLQEANPRYARIVECRFFGGMTIRDTAAALDVSSATVKRGWAVAQAWLFRDMKRSLGA